MSQDLETRIHLDRWKPRDYQLKVADALENKGYRRLLLLWARRAGKDVTCWNLMIRQALKRTGIYYYCLPKYSQARKALWDAITIDGKKFIDFIPPDIIRKKNEQQMKITLHNDSIIQLVGSDDVYSLLGTNPCGIVYSEFAYSKKESYQRLRPILVANQGWEIVQSTPQIKDHFYELYNIAQDSPDWFCQKLTVEDTHHISMDQIERERKEGFFSDEKIRSEYYCEFEAAQGTYYLKYLNNMRLNNQISEVPYEPGFPVNTAWDLGINDPTTIIFFQIIGQTVRIIDCHSDTDEGLSHYASVLASKGYTYGQHWAPFDISQREKSDGISLIIKAREFGIRFESTTDRTGRQVSALPYKNIAEGIEHTRTCFQKIWMDETKCAPLIKSLENYRKKRDERRDLYLLEPVHDKWSHYADAFRYLCLSLGKRERSLSKEDLDNQIRSVYGKKDPYQPWIY